MLFDRNTSYGPNELLDSEVTGQIMTKIFALFFSILLSLIVLPFLYGIIWYEKFGTNSKRTLINQLVCSICWYLIFTVVCLQVPLLIRVIIQDPFNHIICTVVDFTATTLYNLILGKMKEVFV